MFKTSRIYICKGYMREVLFMKKLNENDGKNLLKEIKRTFLASACGIAAMLLSALLFAALIYYGIVPFRAAKLCVAFCCFLGGIVA